MKHFGHLMVLLLTFQISNQEAKEERDDFSYEDHSQALQCPQETVQTFIDGKEISITWPAAFVSEDPVFSGPFCLSREEAILTRQCVILGGRPVWKPERPPLCDYVQIPYQLTNKCPRPYESLYVEDKLICILLTTPQSWQPACLLSGTRKYLLDLEQEAFIVVVNGLRKANIGSVWLPVKRDDEFGPLQIQLPGERWGDIYSSPGHLQFSWAERFSVRSRCLELIVPENENDTVDIATSDCDAKKPIACVFLPDEDLLLQLACPKNYYTSRYGSNQNRCFSVHKSYFGINWDRSHNECSDYGHLASINSASDNYLIEELFDKMNIEDDWCWIGLRQKISGDGYEWVSAHDQTSNLKYFNWDLKTDFKVNWNKYGLISDDGLWNLRSSSFILKCYVCERKSEIPKTNLILRYDPELELLTLNVIGPSGLWKESEDDYGFKCFTDSDGDFIHEVKTEIIKIWDYNKFTKPLSVLKNILTGNANIISQFPKILFKLKLNKNSGNYWCEGHRVLSFELVRSRTVFVWGKKPGNIYALTLDVLEKCNSQQYCEPTFSNIFPSIAKDVKNKLRHETRELLISDVRPIKILDISKEGDLKMIFHVRITEVHGKTEGMYDQALKMLEKFEMLHKDKYRIVSFLDVYHCQFSVTSAGDQILHWPMTPFGHTVAPAELCIDKSGLPVQRTCFGNFTFGASWGSPTNTCSRQAATTTTQTLHTILTSTVSIENITSVEINYSMEKLANENLSNATAADVYYLGCILKNIAQYINSSDSASDVVKRLQDFTKIVNSVYDADTRTLARSQFHLNATNILVDAVESQLQAMASAVNNFEDKGYYVSKSSNIIIQISDPLATNITGIALVKKKHSNPANLTHSFENYDIVQIKSNETLTNLNKLGDIRVATWVPQGLLDEIVNRNNIMNDTSENDTYVNTYILPFEKRKPYVVVVMYYKNNLFQEFKSKSSKRKSMNVGSHIVSVSIPGVATNLPGLLPIMFRPFSQNKIVGRKCAYWDFSYNSTTPSLSFGGWSGEGCIYAGKAMNFSPNGEMDMCVCSHLTNFAELLLGPSLSNMYDEDYSSSIDDENVEYILVHMKVLDIISIIGCTLSILGVGGVMCTAIVFKSWREKPGTKILMQLTLAIGLQMVIFLLANINTRHTQEVKNEAENQWSRNGLTSIQKCPINGAAENSPDFSVCSLENDNETLCIVFGVLLHYSVLCGFSWMLVTAFLQFQRYVKVIGSKRPPHFVLKSTLIGWGMPLIPVITLLSISPYSYVPPYQSHLCYPTGYYLYGGVIAPAAVIILVNSFVFVKVLSSVITSQDGKIRIHSERSIVLSQLKLGILLFFLLGMSWIFGLLLTTGPKLLFSYLFCLTATIQGFVVFLFFVVCDPSTRHLWTSLANSWGKVAMKVTIKKVSAVNFRKEEPTNLPELVRNTNVSEIKPAKNISDQEGKNTSEKCTYRPDRF